MMWKQDYAISKVTHTHAHATPIAATLSGSNSCEIYSRASHNNWMRSINLPLQFRGAESKVRTTRVEKKEGKQRRIKLVLVLPTLFLLCCDVQVLSPMRMYTDTHSRVWRTQTLCKKISAGEIGAEDSVRNVCYIVHTISTSSALLLIWL